jgi:DNA-binding transcriptional LysR family regulator
VQEAPQWLTLLRLVGAGLGVTIAPACVRQIATDEIVCIDLSETTVRSDIELAYRIGEDRAIVTTFAAIARESFRTASRKPHPKHR